MFSLIASLYQRLLPEMYIIHLICFMYLAYYILRIYKEEKSNANQYYQTIAELQSEVLVCKIKFLEADFG